MQGEVACQSADARGISWVSCIIHVYVMPLTQGLSVNLELENSVQLGQQTPAVLLDCACPHTVLRLKAYAAIPSF